MLVLLQGGSGTEPEPETRTVGTAFPETESGTGTGRTVFQESKPEPCLKEEGRGTRSGYEASKGSKGISGL